MLLCLLYCLISTLGCMNANNDNNTQQSCFFLENSEICVYEAQGFKLIKQHKDSDSYSSYIELLYKMNTDSVSIIIRNSELIDYEPPNINIRYLGYCCLDSTSFYPWPGLKMGRNIRNIFSSPVITNDYFLNTDLLSLELSGKNILFKSVQYYEGNNEYLLSVIYESFSKLEKDNANSILDGFTFKSIDDNDIYQHDLYHDHN